MKIIRKTISALLLAGVGITSIQAQNNSSQAWTLRQCIDYAIEHNIEIRQSANNVEAGKVSVNTTKWARLPNLSGSASQNGVGVVPLLRRSTRIVTATAPIPVSAWEQTYLYLPVCNCPTNIHLPNWI